MKVRTRSPKWQPIDDAQVTQWVNFLTPTGCFEWTGRTSIWGYGVIGRWNPANKKSDATGAHRYVYEGLFGPLPDGWEVDHLCSNKLCVNPQHLEAVPKAENVRRGQKNRRYDPKLVCLHGHHKVLVSGEWRCRECARLRAAEYKQRQKQRGGPRVANRDKTHCVNGHEYTPDNTWRSREGRRRCRTCMADYARRQADKRRAARS